VIYLVEDDESIRELVLYTLRETGFEAEGFENPALFWEAAAGTKPDLILLDIMLPGEDGITVLRKIRSMPDMEDIPVMMLTAKGTEYDKVMGLNYGADDYLPKPFGMMELVARVKALLRRSGRRNAKDGYTIGDLRISTSKHEVTVSGRPVALTLKEFELLALMMENQGIVFTRDQLLTRIWGYAFDGESRTVDVHIRSLRQKLGECGSLIETVRGIGYRMGTEKAGGAS
jgi:two-component system alkaline phosphatase synthesis response regulator PhoP